MIDSYRRKSKRKETEEKDIVQLEEMVRDLKEFKDKLILKYNISYSRGSIVETTQGIIDLIHKRIKRKKSHEGRE